MHIESSRQFHDGKRIWIELPVEVSGATHYRAEAAEPTYLRIAPRVYVTLGDLEVSGAVIDISLS